MALFGSKKTPVQTLAASGWGDPAERDALLAQLQQSPPKQSAELVPLVVHQDSAVRQSGTQLFVSGADAEGVKAFVTELGTKSAKMREGLLPLVEHLPAAAVHGAMEQLLTSDDLQARRTAWEVALALPGSIRASYLDRAVFEAPAAMRHKALSEILETSPPDARLDMLLKLGRDKDLQLAQVALKALSTSPDSRVLELMLDRLADGDDASRRIAESYLRRELESNPKVLRRSLLDLLPRGTEQTRRSAIKILIDSSSAEQAVTEILNLGHKMAGWLRLRIHEALREGGEPVLRAAVKLFGHPTPEIRTAALMLAEGFNDKRLVEPFCKLLADKDWWLRVTACEVLGNLKDERAVPHLVRMLQDEDTRWAAVDALAHIGAVSSLQPLSQLLRDPRPEVRMEVLQAFSKFNDRRLLSILKQVRDRDPDADVRLRANDVLRGMNELFQVAHQEGEGGPKVDTSKLSNPLDRLLVQIRDMEASDLHISVGEPPVVRRDGVLYRLDHLKPITAEQSAAYLRAALDDQQWATLEEEKGLDFCHAIPEVGRYRANAYEQRLGLCASFRVIPNRPPSFAELGLPEQLKELLDFHQGVIVISGPSGCGKSTTLTALINLINETKPSHLISLEDPIEFVHPPKQALINQRQVGRDTKAFASGLRAALREDPDIIVVGELRDTDTIRMALEAAETGHLMIGTLHTTNAVQTIDRLVDSFPADEKAQVRMALSESLKYIVCQRLLQHKSGHGRVAAFEVLKGTMSVGSTIRRDETFQLPGLMQIGRQIGMRMLDQSLMDLVEADLISPETAWKAADKPATFAPMCDPGFLSQQEPNA